MSPVQFRDVADTDLSRIESRRAGEWPKVVTDFLSLNKYAVELPIEEGDEKAATRAAGGITVYAKNKELPVRALLREGHVYLRRLDMDKSGTPITDWKAKLAPRKNGKAATAGK